jgi:hypothetical protein
MIPKAKNMADAVKIDRLCARILGDLGSIHARLNTDPDTGEASSMSPEMVGLRRYVREVQDSVREHYPHAFFQ